MYSLISLQEVVSPLSLQAWYPCELITKIGPGSPGIFSSASFHYYSSLGVITYYHRCPPNAAQKFNYLTLIFRNLQFWTFCCPVHSCFDASRGFTCINLCFREDKAHWITVRFCRYAVCLFRPDDLIILHSDMVLYCIFLCVQKCTLYVYIYKLYHKTVSIYTTLSHI